MEKKYIGIICIVAVIVIIAIAALGGGDSTSKPIANVTDVQIVDEGYGMYSLTGKIVFSEDTGYAEINGEAKLSDGSVEDIPLVTNWASTTAGTTYNIDTPLLITSDMSSISEITFTVDADGKTTEFTVTP
ncbi:hypothetical protein [Methanobrevibacter woesei]|uniref:hypothetical protein n=1 Tax=Methanobrevibacter woesei TaxID=190976 RepID=UPI0024B85485|nr:hypothetical protein [Methanobrevibacter woesei]